MARVNYFDNEYLIDSLNANCGASGGKLYLTNKRVFYVSNMGRELWSTYLENIDSHYANPVLGMYVDIYITSNGRTEIFRAFKKGGKLFDKSINDVINEFSPTNKSSITEDFDEDDIDINNDNDYKSGFNVTAFVFVVLAAVFVSVFVWLATNYKGEDKSAEENNIEVVTNNNLVASSASEAEEIAKEQLEWGGKEGTVLQSQCIMQPENNPYGGYVVQVVLTNGNTVYVKFDDSGLFKAVDSSPVK